jgi:hypothetical protein
MNKGTKVKYFAGGDNHTAIRCECGYKNWINPNADKVCQECGANLIKEENEVE